MRPLLLALLAGCAAGSATDDPSDTDTSDGTKPPVDDDVDSYLPDLYVPEAPVRLVYLGDSITAGAGATQERLTYPALLQKNAAKWSDFEGVDLATTQPTLEEVIDVSRGGATTGTLLSQQLGELDRELGSLPATGGTVVVFTIGGNDAQTALNPLADAAAIVDQILDNMVTILDELTDPARFAGPVWVYATNVYEPSDGRGQTDDCFFGFDYSNALPELNRYNRELRTIGEQAGVSIVDLRGHFLGHGWNNKDNSLPGYDAEDATRWLVDDCIHPNDRGHHEIRRLFHAAISGEPLRVVE